MKAKEIMNSNPATIHADAMIRELIEIFNNREIDGMCVVEDENKLVGVVTIFGLFRAFLPDYVKMKEKLAHVMPEGYFEKKCKELRDQPVRSVMRADVIKMEEEDNLISIISDIAHYRLQVIPVTRGETLVGTIHKKDLFSYIGKVFIENDSNE